MLAKYNLYVGSKITDESYTKTSLDEVAGNQDSSALGATWDTDGNDVYPWIGLVSFSDSNYWSENGLKSEYGDSYPAYIVAVRHQVGFILQHIYQVLLLTIIKYGLFLLFQFLIMVSIVTRLELVFVQLQKYLLVNFKYLFKILFF